MLEKGKIIFLFLIFLLSGSIYTVNEDIDIMNQNLGTQENFISNIVQNKVSSFIRNLTTENTYSTYVGGSDSESTPSITVDLEGNVWVVGATTSVNFPTTPDAYNETHGGSYDIFVQKFDGDSGELLYSTFVGGSNYEIAFSAKIDKEGNVWVCGETGSTNFPTTPNAYKTVYNGSVDMFVFKLAGGNGSLLYSSFLGGSGGDSASSISFDSSGNVWIAGITLSSDFPTTPNAIYPDYNASIEAVLCQISKNGSTLLYSSYMGGTGDDYGDSVGTDKAGNIWFLGHTSSSNFPITSNAYDDSYSGGQDIFLCKLSGNGSILLYSTFFGGTSSDFALSLAIDSNSDVWVTGATNSFGFPTTSNAYDDSYSGSYDCVAFKFAENGSLLYSSFFGGTDQDYGRSLTIDSRDSVWISGDTDSSTFPTTPNAFNETYSGFRDSFLLSLTLNGTLQYSSFFGGSDHEIFTKLTLDSKMRVWVTGETESINFPTTPNAFNDTYSGNTDIFLFSLTLFSVPDIPEQLTTHESINYTIFLTWNPPTSEWNSPVNYYRVYRSTISGEYDTFIMETTTEYYVDATLQPGTVYYYVITAVNDVGESSFSFEAVFSFKVPIFNPCPPQNLDASIGGNFIYLYWAIPTDDGGSPINNYSVYRRVACGSYNLIGTTINIYYNDTTIQGGITYLYYITALNSQGESVPSNELVGMVPDIIQPTIYHLEDVSYHEGAIGNNLTWIPIDNNPTSFYITRNNVLVVEGGWDGGLIMLNVDFLPAGTYIFNCTVIDLAGNSASDLITVIVYSTHSITSTSSTPVFTSDITTTTTEIASGLTVLLCIPCLAVLTYMKRKGKIGKKT